MAITDRSALVAGTKLVAKYKGATVRCEVVAGDPEGLRYQLEDGRLFKSPSSAGGAIFGIDSNGKPRTCNGYSFWTIEEATTAATRPARARKAKATSTEPPTPDDAVYGAGIGCAYCAHVSPDATKAAEHMEEAHPTGEPLPVAAYDQEAVAV